MLSCKQLVSRFGQLFIALALVGPGWAQSTYTAPYTFSQFAGASSMGRTDGTGSAAQFALPNGVATDAAGNVYVADTENHVIRKITAAGAVSVFVGSAGSLGNADGTGSAARFAYPYDVAIDTAGNLYVTDSANALIRKVTPAGVTTTLAGTAGSSTSVDGTGTAARFRTPRGLAIDATGNLYVAEPFSHVIRKVTPAGVVTTLAGAVGVSGSADGAGSVARFNTPSDVTTDTAGNVYVADTLNCTIRKISSDGVVSTVAGVAGVPGNGGGPASTARFGYPEGLVVDSTGNIFVSDTGNYAVRRITPALSVGTLVASGGSVPVLFASPRGMAADSAGNIYVADTDNCAIRKIPATGVTSAVAGIVGYAHLDAQGTAARLAGPRGLALDAAGNLYVADEANCVIRKITPAGLVTTLAGSVGVAGVTNGTGAAAQFGYPEGVAVDTAGNVYVADTSGGRIRFITPAGVVTTLAGSVTGSADGTGTAASFSLPKDVAVDGAGNVYVTDSGNHTIRKITPAGVVTTLAGAAGVRGSADGPGAQARFSFPYGLAIDAAANLYVADSSNHTIRKITPAGVVSTLAGSAGQLGSGDGTGSAARFASPYDVTVDGSGIVYVAEFNASLVRRITPDGVVSTVAGQYGTVGNEDGAGNKALFARPRGIVVSPTGRLYVSDLSLIRTGVQSPPQITSHPQNASVTVGGAVSFSVTATSGSALTYQWQFNGAPYSGGTSSTMSFTNARLADAGEYSVVVTNATGSVTSNRATLTVTAAPPPPTPPSSSGGGGGGAPSGWFLGALAMVALLRHGVRARGLF
jgi:sugar lactone lactonase YvrE